MIPSRQEFSRFLVIALLSASAASQLGCSRRTGEPASSASSTTPGQVAGNDELPQTTTKGPKSNTNVAKQAQQMKQVLQLLVGNSCQDVKVSIPLKKAPGQQTEADLSALVKTGNAAREQVTDALARQGFLHLPDIAKEQAVKYGAFSIEIVLNTPLELSKVHGLLGKAITTAEDQLSLPGQPFPGKAPMIWHQYDWLHFGAVQGGSIRVVRVLCDKAPGITPPVVKPAPPKETTIMDLVGKWHGQGIVLPAGGGIASYSLTLDIQPDGRCTVLIAIGTIARQTTGTIAKKGERFILTTNNFEHPQFGMFLGKELVVTEEGGGLPPLFLKKQ